MKKKKKRGLPGEDSLCQTLEPVKETENILSKQITTDTDRSQGILVRCKKAI
jgi:hypothetical protein